MSDPRQVVVDVLNAYKAAVYNKDVDAFTSLYDDNVQVFDMWGTWSCDGIQALRAVAIGWFSSLGSERVNVTADEARGFASGDIGSGHAFLRFAAVSSEGKELRSMNNRITLILRKSGSTWKIVHQHTSAPVDFNSMQVSLQRDISVS